MSYATLDALRAELGSPRRADHAYAAKQLHPIPAMPVIDREGFVLDLVKGKRVLEFGASGKLHEGVVLNALQCDGVDREDGEGVTGFDLDDVTKADLPPFDPPPDLIVCGEVLEHLGNPQHFLSRLRAQYPGVPVLITTPNAFTSVGQKHVATGVENVNIDHVCWYSYRTLKTLLERVGYRMTLVGWYRGEPRVAEGLVALAE